jgi:glycosyltransferase involved in cell wall biosynthesis
MVSGTDENELKSMTHDIKTVVVPNGVDVEYFSVRNENQTNTIIYTGGMNMFANKDAVMHLIDDIWPKIKSRVPDAVFKIIGQDPPAELLAIAAIDKDIQVLGFVDDIRPYVAESAVYVVPLRVGGGTRLKVLDALSQGKAIVSTSVGCEGITVTHGENIFIEDEADAFANRVVELFNDKTLRQRLGQNARLLAEQNYAWESIGQTLNDAYKSVLLPVLRD